MPISSPNLMFDHLLESSHRDDSNKWSNIGFGEEIRQVEPIEVTFTNLIWSSGSWGNTCGKNSPTNNFPNHTILNTGDLCYIYLWVNLKYCIIFVLVGASISARIFTSM